jgi:superfamily I DNA and/or RNA helicase
MKKIMADEIKLGLTITTVDGYQGSEKKYIFVSTVRSNYKGKLGFT